MWEKTAKLEADLDQETHRTTDLTKELSTLKDDLVTLKDELVRASLGSDSCHRLFWRVLQLA